MRPLRITAVVCSATVALVLGSCSAQPSGREALAEAVSTTLPFNARLSGGFAPSNQGPTRAGTTPTLSPDTRIAIAELEKRATAEGTPEAQADLGVAYLVQGDIDRAIRTIEDAASQMKAAAPWSDLSAAYLAKTERTPTRRIEYLARALDAAERSLRLAPTNEAMFNRLLALDELAPYTGTPAPWSNYVAVETNPAWRDAAAREARNEHPVDDVRVRWDVRRKQLAEHLKAGDLAFVTETARLHPEAAGEILERELLLSEATLEQATVLASAIGAATKDAIFVDEVNAVRSHPAQLVDAHQRYAKATILFSANDMSGARRLVTEARNTFRRLNAPYHLWADTRLADVDFREGRYEAAHRSLQQIEREARQKRYVTLLARVLMQQGFVFNNQWRLTEALAAFRESASLSETAGQLENAVSVHATLADNLRMLGESQESWESIGRTLENLTHLRRPLRRYLLLYNATMFASRQGLSNTALVFQDAAVREAEMAGPDALTEATLQRALVHARRGDVTSARVDFDRAAARIAEAPAGAFRSYIGAELEIVRAHLNASGAGTGASADLPSAIAFFRRAEPGRVPNLYLLLARSAEVRDSLAERETALREGIQHLEAQQAGLTDEAFKISFFDESWALFQDMVSLQIAAQKPEQAFEYAERARARSLLAAAQQTTLSLTRTLPEIAAQLPPSVVIVRYSTLADRLLIWTITAAKSTLAERTINERVLGRLVAEHRESIQDGRDRGVNDRLYDLLIEPVATSLPAGAVVVLVPDGQLQQLPFATLRHPQTRQYLIEDHALLISPSATFFAEASRAAAADSGKPFASALLIGNPTAADARPLPGAQAEVAAAAKFYPRHEVLVGAAATKERFVEKAPSFDVVHFGGHAMVNAEFPMLSRLVFADDVDAAGSLFAHEIARVRFPRTRVVVLAACSTAAGALSRGEGVVSVARPFLGGGVPLVIASQWDVDDRATEQLTFNFHRELKNLRDPIKALQAAQIAMLRSGDGTNARPQNWGAFVAVGSTGR